MTWPVEVYVVVVPILTVLLCAIAFGYYYLATKSMLQDTKKHAGSEQAGKVTSSANLTNGKTGVEAIPVPVGGEAAQESRVQTTIIPSPQQTTGVGVGETGNASAYTQSSDADIGLVSLTAVEDSHT